mmetsp:Transcript_13827/g.15978  ORF Transcript_13827/g.15978 Transcript_13827/m.15978 type:complete len:349 (+) Transcript_13827:401-1447(+)
MSDSSSNASAVLSLQLLPGGGLTHFGREVLDIDLASPTLPTEAMVDALYSHGVLLFRNQGHLTPDDEMRFAKLFTHQSDDGGCQSYTGGAGKQHRLPEYPSIALVGSYSVKNFYGLTANSLGVYPNWHAEQRAWHCDGLADTNPPPDLTTMRCLKTPSKGGETIFACSVKAAELLPKSSLDPPPEDVQVHYRLFGEYEIAREGTHLLWARGSKGNTDAENVNLTDGTIVPFVVRERMSGKRTLVGTYHVASLGLIGDDVLAPGTPPRLGFEEANAYMAKAWKPGLAEELLYRHQWRVGDLIAWSNRLVIHTATSTVAYKGEERLHTRIRMRSQPEHVPIAWKSSTCEL